MRHKTSSQHRTIPLLLGITVMHVILFLSACQKSIHEVQDTRFIMGTMVTFTIIADEDVAQKGIVEAANRMQTIELAMTIYGDKDNAIKRFNHGVPQETMRLPLPVDQLLQTSQAVSMQSHGSFSASLGALSLLWGFSRPEPPTKPPSLASIANIVAAKPAHCLHRVGAQQWQRNNKYCKIDLGGIAKGYALDEAITALKRVGIQHAMINAGGDIRMMGMHGERPWLVGIRDPRNHNKIVGVLALSGDKSVVTSGDYERFFTVNGRRYHHILDPQTGYPAMQAQSTTIVASTATMADAWSTALFVAGSSLLPKLEKTAMMALVIDAKGQCYAEKKMRKYLQLKPSCSILRKADEKGYRTKDGQ